MDFIEMHDIIYDLKKKYQVKEVEDWNLRNFRILNGYLSKDSIGTFEIKNEGRILYLIFINISSTIDYAPAKSTFKKTSKDIYVFCFFHCENKEDSLFVRPNELLDIVLGVVLKKQRPMFSKNMALKKYNISGSYTRNENSVFFFDSIPKDFELHFEMSDGVCLFRLNKKPSSRAIIGDTIKFGFLFMDNLK